MAYLREVEKPSSDSTIFGESHSPYLPARLVGSTPFNLIDRQHASLESLRFFASQIVVVHNRLISRLESFENWQKDTYEGYVPAISDAWFLVEMYYQFWQIFSNLGGFKKGTFDYPHGFESEKEAVKRFRNHRQHIAQLIHDARLDKPLGGALVWFHGSDDKKYDFHLISLEGSTRWLSNPFKLPRMRWSPPISSVTLVVGKDTLTLSRLAEIFQEATTSVYRTIGLSIIAEYENGSHPVRPGWCGYTRSFEVRMGDRNEDGSIKNDNGGNILSPHRF